MEEVLRSTLSAQDPAQLVASRAPRDDERRVALLVLCLFALFIGLMTGFGAVALRALIGLIHNGFYNGGFSSRYDANLLEGPSPFGDFVIFANRRRPDRRLPRSALRPGGQGARRSRSDGLVFYGGSNIHRQVAVIKSLASALSIGSGAAVGREGPIIQIGAALGSAFSRVIRLSRWQKVTLLSAGAGPGIAATFNTPLGGVLFALEILLPEVSNRTFLPVVVAIGAATLIGRILIGPDPAFSVPEF